MSNHYHLIKVVMYLCQKLASAKLMEIAEYFELTHPGSVSFITRQVRRELKFSSRLRKQVGAVVKSIMKQAS